MRLKEWHPNRLWYIDAKHELFGFRSIHKMIIVRLATGGLVVHNPIAFSSQLQQVLEELGSVKAIICASPVYHSFLPSGGLLIQTLCSLRHRRLSKNVPTFILTVHCQATLQKYGAVISTRLQ